METVHGFEFFPLTFDQDGRLQSQEEWQRLIARAASAGDVMFIAHGFRNDEHDAKGLYTELLHNLRAHLDTGAEFQGVRDRAPIVAGVFWPSKSFSEAGAAPEGGVQSAGADDERASVRRELEALESVVETPADRERLRQARGLVDRLQDVDVQDQFVDLVLGTVRESQADPAEGLQRVKAQVGSELLSKLSLPVIVPTAGAADGDGGVAAPRFGMPGETNLGGGTLGFGSFVGSVMGSAGKFLNLTTWYLMKERCGLVGANGLAACVRQLKALQPAPKVHLVGHSLGGRLVVSCAKSLAAAPLCRFDSLIMLQAAFSHYGLSTDNGKGVRGFFRDVVERQVVTGPMVATFSFQDGTVGQVYALASRLAGDNVKDVGDRNDPYGGIGRNGAMRLAAAELAEDRLHKAGTAYRFTPLMLHCLDGSGGLIKDHHDVHNPDVTYAIASAMAQA